MMIAAIAPTLKPSLKYIYTRPLLINALRTNANHAEVLCKSNPDSYFGAIAAAIKTAAMAGSRDPKVVVTSTAPAFDAAAMAITTKFTMMLGKLKLCGIAAGGAIILGASKGFPPILVILLGLGVGAGAIWLFVFKQNVESCIVRARAEILPEVDRAIIDGRYAFPPPPR
jgi:hypothetical protein